MEKEQQSKGGQAVSDTPRTNLEAFFPHESMYQVCDADFARQLERELQEANKRIKRLEEVGDELLRDNDDMANINRWHKAKGAKP
jgi:hypothetical protein